MRFPAFPLSACFLLTASLLVVGCGKTEETSQTNDTNKTDGPLEMSEDPPALPPGGEHDHPSEGPHQGELIEFGSEEYHAELLHPESGESSPVTVYILDSSAKKQVPIDAENVTINIQHEGKPEQFQLAASPDKGDPEGKSSRFTSTDANLVKHLAGEEVKGRLAVKINGKSFNGDLSHKHD